jgi:hypothetical protein
VWVTIAGPFPARAAEQELIDKGNALFNQGKFSEALEVFIEAHQRTGHAGLQYSIARCHQELGNLEKALQLFGSFVKWKDCPQKTRDKVNGIILKLRRRLEKGKLILQVSPFGAAVRIDGEHRGNAPVDPVEIRAGSHELDIRAEGHQDHHQVVEIPGAGELSVVVRLEPVVVKKPEKRPREAPQPAPPASRPGRSTWVWVGLGTGVALVAGGTTSVVLGLSDHQKVEDARGYGTGSVVQMTETKADSLIESGSRKKTAGYAILGTGGAVLGAALVLFLIDSPGDSVSLTPGVQAGDGGAVLSLTGRF